MPVTEGFNFMRIQREQSQDEIIQALQRQIDELTADNSRLREELAQKEQFTAMIAHELRGPISPIFSYAQRLARHRCTPEDAGTAQATRSEEAITRYTNVIISQALRLTRLVNDLHDASHLTSGQFTLLREPCDIVALAREIIEQLRPLAPYHTLVMDLPDSPIVGNWDSLRLQQAIGNLLDNAIKYSDEYTTITIRICATEHSAYVSVHNQGAGIPSADMEQLFRPYTRIQATSGTRQGSGLGLYITKSIIEEHGGTLRLEPHTDESASAGPQGTTFSFNLPLG
jgi:signal transduction histidine kinase